MSANKETGLSLIELMVALVLGLLVTGAIGTLFIQNKMSYNQSDETGHIQDNGRYALKAITQELEMSDFWGGYDNPSFIVPLGTVSAPTNSCLGPGELMARPMITSRYLKQPSAPASTFPCVANDYKTTPVVSDFLMTRRVKGAETTSGHVNGQVYLRTDLNTSRYTYIHPYDVSAFPGTDWEYYERVYYVDKDHQLIRQTLVPGTSTTPVMRRDVIVEGIEYFHVVYGLDTDRDGFIDQHRSDPSPAQLGFAISAQVYVLARSRRPVDGYTNGKSYKLGDIYYPSANNATVSVNDGYYRRVFSTTAVLRNTYIVSRLSRR